MATEPTKAATPATTKKAADTKTAVTTAKVESYDISRSDETLALAKDLAKFILDNKLTTNVQGKEFVNVEGWQYAGSRLGIVPIVEHVVNVSSPEEMKYQAKVTLFDMRHGATVGAGFAVCSNKESGKKFYQEFAIMSMAQTRAIGKAYRNCLAWIIRAAGYEPTPAEEMTEMATSATLVAEAPKKPVAEASAPVSAQPAASAGVDASGKAPEPLRVLGTDEATPPAAPVQYAKAAQKEEIIRLLNHPMITRPEKTKMMLNINRLDEERAVQAIAKLRTAIDEREGYDRAEGLRRSLLGFARQHATALGPAEVDRLTMLAEDASRTVEQLQAEMDAARLALDELHPAA